MNTPIRDDVHKLAVRAMVVGTVVAYVVIMAVWATGSGLLAGIAGGIIAVVADQMTWRRLK